MKSKHYFGTLLILLVLSLTTFAQNINTRQGELVAKNFFYERINQLEQTPYNTIEIENVITYGNNASIYIYNFRNSGYVMVSSSMKTIPVIGYSFSGNYKTENPPPQLIDYLDQMSGQIDHAARNTSSPGYSNEWEHLFTDNPEELNIFDGKIVEPLLYTTWDQGNYYNGKCPADPAGPGGHCYAGCVPTAMGQVMNYFRWPLQGTGSYSYSCPPYGTLSADFGNTEYLWNQMPLFLNMSNDPIATLLFHLGVSCDLVYGPNGSGMYNHKAAYSLRTFFKYSPQTEYVYRDSTNMDWDSILVAHLDRNMPMYHAGWSVPNINGHAFVCDGYQDSVYFHFNWGWSGSYDGYFYTSNLSPGGNNFNLAQEVIINCFPDTTNYTYPYYCTGEDTLSDYAGTIGDGSGPIYQYDNNLSCSWLIAPEDSVNFIKLEFLRFNTQANDILTVYDGPDNTSPILGSFSGPDIPEDIVSGSDQVFITFETDNENTGKGWLIFYNSEIPVYCAGLTTLDAVADTFTDGSGPRNYHNETTCLWRIAPEGATEITLSFLEFDTEAGYDVLKVYDGTSLIAELSGGEMPEPITATSGSMFLTFSTNATITAPGWTAVYTTNLVSSTEITTERNIKIIPNPTSGIINIILGNSNHIHSVAVYSMDGKVLQTNNYQADRITATVDITDFEPGLYIIGVRISDTVVFRKIIRE